MLDQLINNHIIPHSLNNSFFRFLIMARIAGINIPTQKKLKIALTYVYGIGNKVSNDICLKANVDSNARVQDLSESEIKNISDVISSSFFS